MKSKSKNKNNSKGHFIRALIFLSVLTTNLGHSQTIDCCDTLMKLIKGREAKTICRKSINGLNREITISIDNSHSANNFATPEVDSHNKPPSCPSSTKKNLEEDNFEWNDFFKNFLTIILALIAGFIALYQMKSNIIASARIHWIEDLRDSLSKLYPAALDTVISATNYRNAKISIDKRESDKYYKEYCIHISNFNALSNKIIMQLNSNEPEHKILEDIIIIIDSKIDTANIDNITAQDIEGDLKLVVSYSKIIFKKEWDKSKKLFEI